MKTLFKDKTGNVLLFRNHEQILVLGKFILSQNNVYCI